MDLQARARQVRGTADKQAGELASLSPSVPPSSPILPSRLRGHRTSLCHIVVHPHARHADGSYRVSPDSRVRPPELTRPQPISAPRPLSTHCPHTPFQPDASDSHQVSSSLHPHDRAHVLPHPADHDHACSSSEDAAAPPGSTPPTSAALASEKAARASRRVGRERSRDDLGIDRRWRGRSW